MRIVYTGPVEVLLVDADGSEHIERFEATLNQTLPGLFELSTPHWLPAVRGIHTICVVLPDGNTISGDVGYVGQYGLTFTCTGMLSVLSSAQGSQSEKTKMIKF
jgi:hypothetical protein